MNKNIVEFKGTVFKCVYNGDNFKTYAMTVDKQEYPNIQTNKYKNVSIVGNLPELTLEVEYEVTAEEQETKYGISYNVINIKRNVPTTSEDVLSFLKEILTIKQAQTLVEHYPDIIDRVRENRLDDIDLSKLKGIKQKSFNIIVDNIISNFYLMDLVTEFKNVLSLSVLKKIYKEYSSVDLLKEKLKKEPYTTLTKISGIGFRTADTIIAELQKENVIDFGCDIKTSPDRCYACLIYLLNQNESEGHTVMNLADLRTACIKLVPACSGHFTTVIRSNDIYYDKSTMEVALKETYETEKYIANDIIIRAHDNKLNWDYSIEEYRKVNGLDLSDEQMMLLSSVCKNNLTVLTAPAGSGKSFSTKALINMLKANRKSFILASPTGKAAKKLSEYTGEEAKTIHRTLGYISDGKNSSFEYHANNPLITDVVILDEVGMVDINLFAYLLKALKPSTKLVLIGDVYQLNSIGCGALLRDLVSCQVIPQITFSKIFRMGKGGVLTACTYVRQNQKFITSNTLTHIGEDKSYTFVPTSKDKINDSVIALYTKLLGKYSANDITVISSYNVGNNGCATLNRLLQPIANPNVNKSGMCITVGKADNQIKFYVGDIVVQCCNNYNVEIYKDKNECTPFDDEFSVEDETVAFIANGDMGEVVKIDGDYIIVCFDNIKVRYHKSSIALNIKHAFALSCHKMQGSQNKVIIFVAPSAHIFMLNNNIVYTAISRAEQTVFHLSDMKTLNIAMSKSDSGKRHTMLEKLLQNH